MRILLVNPPNQYLDRTYLAPPLGLLTLAAVLKNHGYQVSILDLNLKVLSDASLGGNSFYDAACLMITEAKADAIGFTSMCLESHVCLELARRVKISSSKTVTMFGGTHFGAIATELLENFPFVDYVVRGEAEDAILAILEKLSGRTKSMPENVSYRSTDGRQILTGTVNRKSFLLEELPSPAYDLVNLQEYFELNPSHLFNYEAGRGCVFKCSFCYSPFQYGDAVRNKRPGQVVNELRALVQLGARHIFFVQDNFLNSPRWASELCRQMTEANLPLTWECYATYPQLHESLVDLIADAGGKGIFTGIDAVAPDSQRRMNKTFLRNWQRVKNKLAHCLNRGIFPICAFILEPEQEGHEIEATVRTALECLQLGCEVHLNTLSLYNGSALRRESSPATFSFSSIKCELLLDTPKVVQENPFAAKFPHLFPYHSTYIGVNEWEVFSAKVYTLMTVMIGLTRSLYNFVVTESNPIWPILDYIDTDFVKWLRGIEVGERHIAISLRFVEQLGAHQVSTMTKELLRYETAGMLLAEKKNARFATILTNGTPKQYRIAWFMDIQDLKALNDTVGQEMLDSSRGNRTVPHAPVSHSQQTSCDFALMSGDRQIRIYSISSDFSKLLQRLEGATVSPSTIEVDPSHLETLEKNGWIYAVS